MGQYYKIVNLDKKEYVKDNGFLKLMEWNWIGNTNVSFLFKKLLKDWRNDRVIIVGDYSDKETDDYFGFNKKLFLQKTNNTGIYDLGFYDVDELGWTEIDVDLTDEELSFFEEGYFINETKKIYVDLTKLPIDKDEIVSPTILLACGNGRGGGDYSESYPDYDKVGTWAGKKISFSTNKPNNDYIEVKYNFKESD